MVATLAAAVVILRAAAQEAPPPEFDCAMRKLALSYGHQLQPHRDLSSLQRGLGLDAGACTAPLPAVRVPVSDIAAPGHRRPATAVWYVSPAGSDAAPGTEHAPFKTLAHAVNASRAAVAPGAPRTILLGSGIYHLTATVELTELDSHLTIAASEPGSPPPVLSGGVPLGLPAAAWSVHRVLPEGAVYAATLPPGTPMFDQLFAGHERQVRAKHPNGNPETMRVPISSKCDGCGYYAGSGKLQWLAAPRVDLPHSVVNADWTDGAPVLPKPNASGYILNVTRPFCANCSSEGGERKFYQAVVGGTVASKFDPPVMPGPPRAHMHATSQGGMPPVGVTGATGFPNVSGWIDAADGVVVDMQAQSWGNFWWKIANVSEVPVSHFTGKSKSKPLP